MDEKNKAKVLEMIQQADMVLVGIGRELESVELDENRYKKTYDRLAKALQGKNYFIITTNADDCVYASPFLSDRIVAPCGSIYSRESYMEQWDRYTKWLTDTLNRRLFILELGVLMELPAVIRWPFEKITFLNEKAFLIRLNKGLPQLSAELKGKALSIECHPVTFFDESFEE